MPKTRGQKETIVKQYFENAKSAKSLVFVNFNGMSVKGAEELRQKCREADSEYHVVKKTLMKRAFKDAGIDVDPANFEGDVGTVFGYEDEVAPARVVKEVSKTHEFLKPIGGVLENVFIGSEKVLALAELPTKKQLHAKLVGTMQAPISNFVGVLSGNIRSFVQVLKSIEEKKS